ncbi:MAG: serine hydrolase [Rhodospirillales bacterium]|nr:serine hydrolase [Rhodospirillales bacterium]
MTASADWPMLATSIAKAEQEGATLGVCVLAPDGSRFAHHATRRFVAASTVKIAIMVELFRRIDAGALRLDESQRLRAEDKADGSGVLARLHTGLELTLGDLAYLMMSISDNSATNMLIERLGMTAVNATMQALGMRQSVLGRKMRGALRNEGEQENWAVPEDYAALIAAILHGQAASAASCAAMQALLESQQNERRLARHLPQRDRPRWGSKTGSLPGVCNDVGFVLTPVGPLILAVFCENPPDPHAGEAIIGAIAQAAMASAAATGRG